MAIEAATDGIEQLFLVRDKKPYKYLPDDAPYLVDAPIGGDEFERLTNSVGKGDRIIIHFLSPNVRRWLAVFNTEATIEWVFWSSDFYVCMYNDFPEYEPITKAYLQKGINEPLSRFKLIDLFRKQKLKRKKNQLIIKFEAERDAAARKISVFHHYIKEEHELIEKLIPLKARFNFFCYSQDIPFNEIYELSRKLNLANSPLNINETNLMVGNSGFPYSNHSDTFRFLKDRVRDVNIILPLSYGDKAYIKHIISVAEDVFGSRMLPFMDYMLFEQYLELLMSCQGMIIELNTVKAMGNIHTLLLLGKRVFVKRDTLAYNYFKRRGIKINAIDEFSEALLNQPEESEIVANNVKLILEMHSFSKNYSYVENMIKLVN